MPMRRTLTAVCPKCRGDEFDLAGAGFYCVVDGTPAVFVPERTDP
jgi:hypothetical protein